jgi:hypothetical protein
MYVVFQVMVVELDRSRAL